MVAFKSTKIIFWLAVNVGVTILLYIVDTLFSYNLVDSDFIGLIYVMYIVVILTIVTLERKSLRSFRAAYESQWKGIAEYIVLGKGRESQNKANHVKQVKSDLKKYEDTLIRYTQLFFLFTMLVLGNTYSVQLGIGNGIPISPVWIFIAYIGFQLVNAKIESNIGHYIDKLEY